MRHVMLDLETFGTAPGSVLRSVGAVVFDLDEGLGEEFYANVDKESCLEYGLTVDTATEAWWSRQSAEAQASLLKNPLPIGTVVSQFHSWFVRQRAEYVWSQGAGFDVPLWEAAAKAVSHRVPWKFWNARDTRTVYHLFGFDPDSLTRGGTYHNALDDAKHQVRCVQAALRRGRPATCLN